MLFRSSEQPPLAWSHNRVEGNAEYTQLLYIPQHATQDLWDRTQKTGIKLYVRRVFIMDDAEQLLPRYLRFVKGVVDSADLPLNVSRELLQQSRDVKAIREGNTRRVLSMLEELAKQSEAKSAEPSPADAKAEDAKEAGQPENPQPEGGKYAVFWRAFGAVLKEGLGEDAAQRERLLGLQASKAAIEGVLADLSAASKVEGPFELVSYEAAEDGEAETRVVSFELGKAPAKRKKA